MIAPKVFLSHASEDKQRFVNSFATALRAKGIDVWLDKWEILPGDSLVDKLFEEGLKEAEAVLIVVSATSVTKPWVRQELNTAVVNRITRQTKIIPVVLDEADVPEALRTLVWESISDLTNYSAQLDSLEILTEQGYLKMSRVLGGAPRGIGSVQSTLNGFMVFARANLPEIEEIMRRIALAILNEGMSSAVDISAATGIARFVVENVLDLFASKHWVKVSNTFADKHVYGVSPSMKRAFA